MRPLVQIAVVVVAGLWLGSAARAQQEAPPSAYEDLVKRGEAAVIGADWDSCVKYFTQAHQLRPSEVTYLAIGRCALERGDYVDALRHLQEGMRYSLTERQRVSVENLKARALQHLGRYRLALQPANATLLIGGQPIHADAEGYVWFKVGRYPVSVSAPGHESMSGELVVQAGDDGVISYNLPALAPQAPSAASEPGAPAPAAREGGSGSEFPVVPVVVMSIGGALLIGSAVTGAIALGKKGDLDDRCILGENRNLCDPSLEGTRDSAQTLAIVTDVLWIGGTLAVGTGLLLWLLGSDKQEASVNVSAAAGPTGGALQIAGKF